MSNVLDILREDHAQFRVLLKALKKQADCMATGERHDLDLLEDGLRYLHDYSQQIHHPAEEWLLDQIGGDARALHEELHHQHQGLEGRVLKLEQAIEAIRNDQMVPREDLVDTLNQIIDALRQHIDWEESRMFPGIEDAVAAMPAAQMKGDALLCGDLKMRPLEAQFQRLISVLEVEIGSE